MAAPDINISSKSPRKDGAGQEWVARDSQERRGCGQVSFETPGVPAEDDFLFKLITSHMFLKNLIGV